MKLPLKDTNGNSQGEVELGFALVEGGRGSQAVHEVVTAYRAAQRSGTASTKTMGEVAGTGKKPWRQKGTGRARAGSFASPLWRGGGVVFGPKPRDFRKKVSRATRQLALRKALGERAKAGDIVVVGQISLGSPKTKEFIQVRTNLGLDAGTLTVVVAESNDNLSRAARNVSGVRLVTSQDLSTYDVLRSDKILFTQAAFENVAARLQA